jgi:hypothetical protein
MFVDQRPAVTIVRVLAMYANFFICSMYDYVSTRRTVKSVSICSESSFAKLQGLYGGNPPLNEFRTDLRMSYPTFPNLTPVEEVAEESWQSA